MHVYMCLRVEESVYLFVYLSVCLLASLSIYLSFLMFVCLSVSIYICLSVCLSHRQQIEDCETEIQRLKELLKKREENERKYHGQLRAFLHPRPNHSALSSPLLVNMSTLGSSVNDSSLACVFVLVKQCLEVMVLALFPDSHAPSFHGLQYET